MLNLKDLEQFFYNLLCKRKRRILILTRWHSSKCTEGNDIHTVITNFFKLLLYEPIRFQLHHDHIKIFQGSSLKIPFIWMNDWERSFICKLYVNRKEVFNHVQVFTNNGLACTNCKYNSASLWPIENRREMLRDFIWLTLKNKQIHNQGYFLFKSVCERLKLEIKEQDQFVNELYNVLQGREKIEHLQCYYY